MMYIINEQPTPPAVAVNVKTPLVDGKVHPVMADYVPPSEGGGTQTAYAFVG